MIDWLIDCLYFDWCYSYTCTLGTVLSVWRLCHRLWHRGLSLWQPAVPSVDAGSSHWQHLSVLVFTPYEYILHAMRSWPGSTCSCHLCSALLLLMIDWLIVFILINATPKYVHWGWGLSVWPYCRFWYCGLSLWQPAVPPVDARSSHWRHTSLF